MSAKLASAFIALLLLSAIGYYIAAVYPPVVLKRATARALEQMQEAVDSHDRARIGTELEGFFTESAQISLDVSFFSIVQQAGSPAHRQQFDRQEFIKFIDDLIYPTDDYALYYTHIDSFELSEQADEAEVSYTAKIWADSLAYFGGTGVRTRYSATGECKAHVLFEDRKAQFDKLHCNVTMRSVPRPEETEKMRDPKVLQEFLRQP